MLDVEMEAEFSAGGHPFVGYMDYLGEKGGEYYIIDNKSRMPKPRSKRSKPAKHDMDPDRMPGDESPIYIMCEPATLVGSRHACS